METTDSSVTASCGRPSRRALLVALAVVLPLSALDTTARAEIGGTPDGAIGLREALAKTIETEPEFSRVDGDLLTLPTTESFAALRARIERNPQLVRFVSKERLVEANLRPAEARRWPTLRPTVGLRRHEATDDVAIVAELKIPLPVRDRNQGRISETRATLAQTSADADAARVRVQTSLFEMYQEPQHHLHRANTLRDEVVPLLAKALGETRAGYELGRYSYFEWRSVQAELLEAQHALVEASTGAHRLVIVLERLTGERVAQP